MKFNRIQLDKILKTTMLSSLFILAGKVDVNALDVEPIYELEGIEQGYVDKDVPVALKVKKAEDGLKVGAYLYRHIHQGFDYYAPWTPGPYVGTITDANNNAYAKWGLWDMAANKAPHSITATYYYETATVKSGGASAKNSNGDNAGTLPGGTVVNVYGIDNGEVYINSEEHSQLSKGSSRSELVALKEGDVTFNGSKKSLMHSGYKDKVLLQNFKAYGKYTNNATMYHKGLEWPRWYNQDEDYVPEEVRGVSGEWRYIGYNRYGDPVDNPYFPSDVQSCNSSHIYSAVRRHTPWDKTDAQEGESDPNYAYTVFTRGMSSTSRGFEYDTQSKFSEMKDYVVDKLYEEGCIKTKSGAKDQISLRTNAYKQSIVLRNQRKAAVYYGVPFLEGTLRDLYPYSIEIYDIHDEKVIASLKGSINGSKVEKSGGKYIPGRTYEIRLKIANGTDAKLIKKSLQAHIGLVYGAGDLDKWMTFNKTKNGTTIYQGNRGGLGATKGSVSNTFVHRFTVSTKQTGPIDIYGFVGIGHTEVDNLSYDNDIIGIRLTKGEIPDKEYPCAITNNGTVKTCGEGDIVPVSIELIDESGAVKYKYNATNGSVTQNAIIPGRKYKIRYTAKYVGETIKKYTWVTNVNDNPNTDGDEYVAGHWKEETAKYKIPLTYNITRGIKNPSTTESYSYNGSTIYFSKGDSVDIPMVANTTMSYTTDYIMFQYPKLTTGFKITSTSTRVNQDRTNDSLSTTINDNFDIEIENLVVRPLKSYTNGQTKKVNYLIGYDARLTTPSYVTRDDYQAYVNTAISINGEVYNKKDHLIKGNNTKISHIINDVPMPGKGDVTVSVNINSDKLSYESGNYNNNKASTIVKVEEVKNPGLGSANETVKATDNSNNNSPTKGGDANDNCLTPRTKNTWTSTHRKLNWGASNVTYNTLVSNEKVTFKNYAPTYYNASEATETYSENFGITQVLFKSKETEGKGSNGWIDLLKAEGKDAKVKAGYGFELKIVTKYSTDALTKRAWSLSNGGTSGTSVSSLNGAINYGMEDIFLELPGTGGTDGTRKILSVSGHGDSMEGLLVNRAAKSDGSGDVTWTYTIKPANTLGIGETAKIYIPQGMKNGDYKLKIYTTPVQGVGSVNKNQYSALCDRKEVTIKVDGAATDDLNSNIIQ